MEPPIINWEAGKMDFEAIRAALAAQKLHDTRMRFAETFRRVMLDHWNGLTEAERETIRKAAKRKGRKR